MLDVSHETQTKQPVYSLDPFKRMDLHALLHPHPPSPLNLNEHDRSPSDGTNGSAQSTALARSDDVMSYSATSSEANIEIVSVSPSDVKAVKTNQDLQGAAPTEPLTPEPESEASPKQPPDADTRRRASSNQQQPDDGSTGTP